MRILFGRTGSGVLRGFVLDDLAGDVGVRAAVDAAHLATLAVFADCFAVIVAVECDEICVAVNFAAFLSLARRLKDVRVLAPFASKRRDA